MGDISYHIEQLLIKIHHQLPIWPTTYGACDCGRGRSRGGRKCLLCLEEELATYVGEEKAKNYIKTAKELQTQSYDMINVKGEQQCSQS